MSESQTFTVSIVEDEPVLQQELAFQLRQSGFCVETFDNATQLYRYLATHPNTIAVLDIGLLGEDGLSICEYLRSHDSQMGIVFATARGLREDRLKGLDVGADAYLVKPIDLDELVLVLKRLAQRFVSQPEQRSVASASNEWRLEGGSSYLIAPNQSRVRVSLTEVQVLGSILRKRGVVCTHAELSIALGLLPEEYNNHRAEVILSRLREKVLRETGVPLPIKAERGTGYYIMME